MPLTRSSRLVNRATTIRLLCGVSIWLWVLGGVFTPPVLAQATPTAPAAAAVAARVQSALDSLHAGARFPGATFAMILPDGREIAVATGWADTAQKIRMTPSALLMQGSVGKTYAAAVALQLVREGKLSLDEKIERYLGSEPWFSRLPNARDITVRMLMNHTSGLVRYEFKEQFTRDLSARPDKMWKPEELVAYIFDTAAPFAAGQGWEYSDTNYIVLGMIIERLTGAPYYAEVKRRLLEPLGLRSTVPTDRRVIPGLAQGYAGPDNPFGGSDAVVLPDGRFVINPQFEWTGGGMASTTLDLVRWARALYEGDVLDAQTRALMLQGVPSRLGPNSEYGLGVIIRRSTPLGPAYGHSGFFPGYVTEMMYFPQSRITAAIQVNTSVQGAVGRPPARALIDLVQAATR